MTSTYGDPDDIACPWCGSNLAPIDDEEFIQRTFKSRCCGKRVRLGSDPATRSITVELVEAEGMSDEPSHYSDMTVRRYPTKGYGPHCCYYCSRVVVVQFCGPGAIRDAPITCMDDDCPASRQPGKVGET